jgi:26S proteasome regulatory subunit (ATPase 3-interacting protein)
MSKVTEERAIDVVYEYLSKMSRPFSAGEIHNNLQTEFGLGKTLVQKALDNMTQEGNIKEKVYGKSKIYFIDQSKVEVISQETIDDYVKNLEKYTQYHQDVSKEVKKLENRLNSFSKQMPMEDIKKTITSLTHEVAELEERLKKVQGSCKGVDPEDNKNVKTERVKLVGEWKKRKRLANNALEMLMEGYPHPKKRLIEEIGIETDEDNDAVIPEDI